MYLHTIADFKEQKHKFNKTHIEILHEAKSHSNRFPFVSHSLNTTGSYFVPCFPFPFKEWPKSWNSLIHTLFPNRLTKVGLDLNITFNRPTRHSCVLSL